jgi:hypothetical protein
MTMRSLPRAMTYLLPVLCLAQTGCGALGLNSQWTARAGGDGLLGEAAAWGLTHLDTSACNQQHRQARQHVTYKAVRRSRQLRKETKTYAAVKCG